MGDITTNTPWTAPADPLDTLRRAVQKMRDESLGRSYDPFRYHHGPFDVRIPVGGPEGGPSELEREVVARVMAHNFGVRMREDGDGSAPGNVAEFVNPDGSWAGRVVFDNLSEDDQVTHREG